MYSEKGRQRTYLFPGTTNSTAAPSDAARNEREALSAWVLIAFQTRWTAWISLW